MGMKSKDLLRQELMTNLSKAMQSEDEGAIAQAFTDFAESVQQSVLEDVKLYQQTADKEILAKRGKPRKKEKKGKKGKTQLQDEKGGKSTTRNYKKSTKILVEG